MCVCALYFYVCKSLGAYLTPFRGSRLEASSASCFWPHFRPLGWPIKGPRTTKWLYEQFRRLAQSPTQRHMWWRQVQGLGAADPGVDEHQFLSEVLEAAVQVDQVNASNLAAFEMISRRYQLWEEIYAHTLRESEAGATAHGSAWLDERSIFLG